MYKQFSDIKFIRFPVYALKSADWYYMDNVLFLEDLVLDDKNMPGKSLGIRRLQCGRTDLYKLKKAYTNIESMLSRGKHTFIDSKGTPFIYVKTKVAKLKSHLVNRIDRKETYSLVWLKSIPNPFHISRPPYGDARYGRVLYYNNMPWVLYDFTQEQHKDSYRRV